MRRAKLARETAETKITIELDLDGTGASDCATGIGFFDHMLDQIARHSLIDLHVRAEGDLHIDDHHTVEDTGIVLGQALLEAGGDKRGIRRYGSSLLPMDEALVRALSEVAISNIDALQRMHPALAGLETDRIEDGGIPLPLHPAALPGWVHDDQEPQGDVPVPEEVASPGDG